MDDKTKAAHDVLEDVIHGQGTSLAADVVTQVAGMTGLSAADLETIAANMGNASLADSRLRDAQANIVAWVDDVESGKIVPSTTPGQSGGTVRTR